MKKSFLPLLSTVLLLTACKKSETVQNGNVSESNQVENTKIPDSAETDNSAVIPENQVPAEPQPVSDETALPDIPKGPTDGVVTTEKYIYSDYPSDNLPMEKLERTVTNENQVVYVKIQNAKAGEVFHVKVEHEKPDGNIAVNHVYGPGMQDGPFGREANYKIPKDGDYTFAINKNNRAEGSQKGKILITFTKN